ncbi:MAG: NUDIX hydrolase [Candidatus Electrothrix sp. YB6]
MKEEECKAAEQNTSTPVKEKAGVVAYKPEGSEPLVLLVSARKVKGSWVFPVGGIDPGETAEIAAQRECEEESGYRVELGEQLASVESCVKGKTVRFIFFLASVVSEAETWETDRTREWVPLSQAADRLPSIFQSVAAEAAQYLAEQN